MTASDAKSKARQSEVQAAAALKAWATVSRAMLEDRRLEEMLDLIASTAASLTGQSFAAVLLVNPERTQLEMLGSYGLSPSYVDRMNHEMPLMLDATGAGRNAAGTRAYMTGRPAVLHFDSEDGLSPWSDLAEEQGYISLASAPLTTPEGQIGALNVYARKHTDFSSSQMMLLEALATEAAAAIQIMEMRVAQRQTIQELEQSDRMQQALATVALADEGLDPITATLAKLTTLGIAVDDGVTGATLSHAALSDASTSAIDAARQHLKFGPHETSRDRGDVLVEGGGLVTLEPVSLGNETIAYLWACSDERELTALQRRVLERGAVLVALELLKQRDARAAEWRVRGELLDELMAASLDEQDRVFERALALGHDLRTPHTPIVIRPDVLIDGDLGGDVDGAHGLRRIVAITHAVAAEYSVKPLIGTFAGAVVIMWPTDDRPPAEIADAIRRYVASRTAATVSVCVGDSSVTLRDYGQSTRLALGAIRLLQSSGRRNRQVSLDELGIFRVLLSVDDEELLKDTARQVLGPLMDYDSARDGAMFATLTTFMDADMNVAEAAKALHLHPNSLHYRLRRIEELLGVRLRSPHDLVDVSFALAIDRLYPST